MQQNLLRRIDSFRMKDKIFQVLVPTEEEIEFRDGKRRTVQKNIYRLRHGQDDHGQRHVVRRARHAWRHRFRRSRSRATGIQSWPTPLPDEERADLRVMGMVEPVEAKIDLQRGQAIRVTHGPFQDFHGVVEEVNRTR